MGNDKKTDVLFDAPAFLRERILQGATPQQAFDETLAVLKHQLSNPELGLTPEKQGEAFALATQQLRQHVPGFFGAFGLGAEAARRELTDWPNPQQEGGGWKLLGKLAWGTGAAPAATGLETAFRTTTGIPRNPLTDWASWAATAGAIRFGLQQLASKGVLPRAAAGPLAMVGLLGLAGFGTKPPLTAPTTTEWLKSLPGAGRSAIEWLKGQILGQAASEAAQTTAKATTATKAAATAKKAAQAAGAKAPRPKPRPQKPQSVTQAVAKKAVEQAKQAERGLTP